MHAINSDSACVRLFEHDLAAGLCLAQAHLNAEATLNSLSLDMIDILEPALRAWQTDERVVAVVLSAAGDRAFSAGGDVQALYHAMVENHFRGERVDDYPYDFFEREYRLDYLIHTYTKPVIALGHGIVMGGGLGLFSASNIRVVTERTRVAMPEVSIGLFPDAGATWLLRNLPEHVALFLGMTGSAVNATDAMAVGLATHAVAAATISQFPERLLELAWQGQPDADGQLIADCLAGLAPDELADGNIQHLPRTLTLRSELSDVVAQMRALAGQSAWIDKGLASMGSGCPSSVGIVHEQLLRSKDLSLADCFRLEMTVATHCADNHDFMEGVRALLIEKDNAPVWQFGDLESVPHDYIDSHFVEPWPENPLHDLVAS